MLLFKKNLFKVDSKLLFVMGFVINIIVGDIDGSVFKDVREVVIDIEIKNVKDSMVVIKVIFKNIKEDGLGKKVKFGFKVRRFFWL